MSFIRRQFLQASGIAHYVQARFPSGRMLPVGKPVAVRRCWSPVAAAVYDATASALVLYARHARLPVSNG